MLYAPSTMCPYLIGFGKSVLDFFGRQQLAAVVHHHAPETTCDTDIVLRFKKLKQARREKLAYDFFIGALKYEHLRELWVAGKIDILKSQRFPEFIKEALLTH